jgi:hypothetical protein
MKGLNGTLYASAATVIWKVHAVAVISYFKIFFGIYLINKMYSFVKKNAEKHKERCEDKTIAQPNSKLQNVSETWYGCLDMNDHVSDAVLVDNGLRNCIKYNLSFI